MTRQGHEYRARHESSQALRATEAIGTQTAGEEGEKVRRERQVGRREKA